MNPSLRSVAVALLAIGIGLGQVNVCSSFQVNLPLGNLPSTTASTSKLFRGDLLLRRTKKTFPSSRVSSSSVYPSLFSTSLSEPSKTETEKDEEEGVGAWIPLASIKSMTGLGPQRITVMGVDLAVWHTEADEKKGEKMVWSAQVDACAHRLAPLSQGRVDPKTNCVECP